MPKMGEKPEHGGSISNMEVAAMEYLCFGFQVNPGRVQKWSHPVFLFSKEILVWIRRVF